MRSSRSKPLKPLPLDTIRWMRTRQLNNYDPDIVSIKNNILKPSQKAQLKRIFAIFDSTNDGNIDLLELQQALLSYGYSKAKAKQYLQIFEALPSVQDDGEISFDEFLNVMSTSNTMSQPKMFYFLQDEMDCREDISAERFSNFSSNYERLQNKKGLSLGGEAGYDYFSKLFNGSYNVKVEKEFLARRRKKNKEAGGHSEEEEDIEEKEKDIEENETKEEEDKDDDEQPEATQDEEEEEEASSTDPVLPRLARRRSMHHSDDFSRRKRIKALLWKKNHPTMAARKEEKHQRRTRARRRKRRRRGLEGGKVNGRASSRIRLNARRVARNSLGRHSSSTPLLVNVLEQELSGRSMKAHRQKKTRTKGGMGGAGFGWSAPVLSTTTTHQRTVAVIGYTSRNRSRQEGGGGGGSGGGGGGGVVNPMRLSSRATSRSVSRAGVGNAMLGNNNNSRRNVVSLPKL